MAIDPFVSLFVYVAVAAAIMARVMFLTNGSDERLAGAFVAMLWPALGVLLLMLSPVWLGIGVFHAVQALKRRGQKHDN